MTDHALAVLGGLIGGALVAAIAYVYWLCAPGWRKGLGDLRAVMPAEQH